MCLNWDTFTYDYLVYTAGTHVYARTMYMTVDSKASQYFKSRQCLKKTNKKTTLELPSMVLEPMTIMFLCYVVPGSTDDALVNELISLATIYIHVYTYMYIHVLMRPNYM